jgi:hypothetical protein
MGMVCSKLVRVATGRISEFLYALLRDRVYITASRCVDSKSNKSKDSSFQGGRNSTSRKKGSIIRGS